MFNIYKLTIADLGRLMDYYERKYQADNDTKALENWRKVRDVWQEKQRQEYI